MPLTGDAKRVYQAAYMRARRATAKVEKDAAMSKLDYARDKARSIGIRSARDDIEIGSRPPTAYRSASKERAKWLETLAKIVDSSEGYAVLQMIGVQRGYQSGWAAHRFRERFNHWPWDAPVAPGELPPWDIEGAPPITKCPPGQRTIAPTKIDKFGRRC